MEYIYAALMLHRLGKPVDEAHITKVMTAAGASIDEAKVKTLIASLAGVDINKELENAAIIAAAPAVAGVTEKKEEKEEVKAEAAAEGLSSLFG